MKLGRNFCLLLTVDIERSDIKRIGLEIGCFSVAGENPAIVHFDRQQDRLLLQNSYYFLTFSKDIYVHE